MNYSNYLSIYNNIDYLFYCIVNQKGSSNSISHEYFETKEYFKVLNWVKLLDELLIFPYSYKAN